MQAHNPVPPVSPHPVGPYSRFAANQPLNAGAVYDAAPPPPPLPIHSPQSLQSPQGIHSPQSILSPQSAHFPQYPPGPSPYHAGRRPQPIGIPPNSGGSSHYPPGPPTSVHVARKRLIVACDGTWLDADAAVMKSKQIPPPSNVTRISRAIKSQSSDHVSQVVYYQAGLGTRSGKVSNLASGTFGEGLSQNVREGYSFIANNYHQGDEIFLIGFSRGAFTARTIGGLIGAVGLLTKAGLDDLGIVFADWEHRFSRDYVSPHPDIPFRRKPNAADPGYAQGLQELGLTRLGVRIKAIAVFDTVGSLGIPRVPILERLHIQNRRVKEFAFYDTTIDPCVENAFQALALDEQRAAFSPALWEKTKKSDTVLRQVWFPGVHSNVGGGYADQEIANITLAWMMAQLEQFLDFHDNYIQEQHRVTHSYYKDTGQQSRQWSFGEIYNSYKGLFSLAGKVVRTPGNYMRVDPDTGRPTRKPLRETNEYIHPSVRSRSYLDAPGVEDKGLYYCRAMEGFKLKMTGNRPEDRLPLAEWESRSKRKGVPRKVLRESPLWDTERKLLAYSKEVQDFIFKPPKPKKPRPPVPAPAIPELDEDEDGDEVYDDDGDVIPPPRTDRPPRRNHGGGGDGRPERRSDGRPERRSEGRLDERSDEAPEEGGGGGGGRRAKRQAFPSRRND